MVSLDHLRQTLYRHSLGPLYDYLEEQGERVAFIPFREHAAATANEVMYAWVAPVDCTITGCDVIFDANITGADTNYTSFGVIWESGVGGFGNIVHDDFTSGTNATAGEPHEFGTDNIPVQDIVAGSTVKVQWTKTGDGLKTPTGLLVLKYTPA